MLTIVSHENIKYSFDIKTKNAVLSLAKFSLKNQVMQIEI